VKPQRAFVVDRVVARHCPELLAAAIPAAGALEAPAALLAERLARRLTGGLARLSSEPPLVRALPSREIAAGEADRDGLCSYAVLGIGAERQPALLTLAAEPVLRMVDRAFGGRGEVPDPLPAALPLSAELLVARLEGIAATALAEALGIGPIEPLRRDSRLSQLAPFAAGTPLIEQSVEIEERGMPPWRLVFALPQPLLASLFAGREPKPRTSPAQPDPASEPFGSLPVRLTAVLVDMPLSFSRLAALRPGDVLPVAVARNVPVKAGGRTIASGTVGEFEDRVALQLTSVF